MHPSLCHKKGKHVQNTSSNASHLTELKINISAFCHMIVVLVSGSNPHSGEKNPFYPTAHFKKALRWDKPKLLHPKTSSIILIQIPYSESSPQILTKNLHQEISSRILTQNSHPEMSSDDKYSIFRNTSQTPGPVHSSIIYRP